jgi:hypothetical protein
MGADFVGPNNRYLKIFSIAVLILMRPHHVADYILEWTKRDIAPWRGEGAKGSEKKG